MNEIFLNNDAVLMSIFILSEKNSKEKREKLLFGFSHHNDGDGECQKNYRITHKTTDNILAKTRTQQ